MSDLRRPPLQERVLQLYATASYPCSYLPEQTARSQVVVPLDVVDTGIYAQLIAKGFRRSGSTTYRPWCDNCRACVPLRIPVDNFSPNRSQRRAWRQHEGLSVRVLPLEEYPGHYALYRDYQLARHAGCGMDKDDPEDYRSFILQSPVDAMLVEFREGDVLKMVALLDVLPDALSAVYTFYAGDAGAAYGTFAVLWQIAFARQTGRRHVYLGYWIAESSKMHYKTRFRPYEILQGDRWVRCAETPHA